MEGQPQILFPAPVAPFHKQIAKELAAAPIFIAAAQTIMKKLEIGFQAQFATAARQFLPIGPGRTHKSGELLTLGNTRLQSVLVAPVAVRR